MTKELNEALVTIINTTLKATETAVNFLSSELPDVVAQLILFNTVWNWFLVIVPAIFVILSLIGVRIAFKMFGHSDDDGARHLLVLSFVSFIISITILVANLKSAIIITIAPKIWLIEYASTLVKGH